MVIHGVNVFVLVVMPLHYARKFSVLIIVQLMVNNKEYVMENVNVSMVILEMTVHTR